MKFLKPMLSPILSYPTITRIAIALQHDSAVHEQQWRDLYVK